MAVGQGGVGDRDSVGPASGTGAWQLLLPQTQRAPISLHPKTREGGVPTPPTTSSPQIRAGGPQHGDTRSWGGEHGDSQLSSSLAVQG